MKRTYFLLLPLLSCCYTTPPVEGQSPEKGNTSASATTEWSQTYKQDRRKMQQQLSSYFGYNEGAQRIQPEDSLSALSHPERLMLARALINTHDWGSWQQHDKLAQTFLQDSEAGNPLVNKHIVSKINLPELNSPALRKAIQDQLKAPDWCWPSFCGFIAAVTDDYLPENPHDARAWEFLSFMVRLSDGEVLYCMEVCRKILDNGLDRFEEGQRIIHHWLHWKSCGSPECSLCR